MRKVTFMDKKRSGYATDLAPCYFPCKFKGKIDYWITPDGLKAELPQTPKMEKIIKKLQRKEAVAKNLKSFAAALNFFLSPPEYFQHR